MQLELKTVDDSCQLPSEPGLWPVLDLPAGGGVVTVRALYE